ncbi:MAG: HAD family hydrolase [Dehalococcoidia bacterium]|nr:MAG: HAD family hydrolase [Dehalococcoidia bacterium]
MAQIKVISFDVEGTLATFDFSQTIWHEGIPALYAQKEGIELDQAREIVIKEYDKVGDQRLEWYDINYWFRYFQLGSPQPMLESYQHRVRYYPEVTQVLSSLGSRYELIVASGTPLELLNPLLKDIRLHFTHIFSSTSHYRQLKTPEFYLAMCKVTGIEPSQVVHVGDSWQFDFLNSKQVGILAFHLDRSGSNHASLHDLTQLEFHLPG